MATALTPNQMAANQPGNNVTGSATANSGTIPQMTPGGTSTVQAPSVVTSTPATTNATQIQTNLNNQVAGGQQIQSAKSNLTTTYDAQGNMVQTGGTLPNGTTYTNVIPKGAPGYVPNPADVASTAATAATNAQTTATNNQTAALTSAAGGTATPTTTTPVLPGIDVSTPSGQAEWYNQDQNGYEAWANANGVTSDQQFQISILAGNQQIQSIQTQGNNALNQYLTGTFPLTDSQQSQVAGLQQMWQATINAQQNANSSYVAANAMVSARAGGQYDPLGSLASANRAIQDGLSRIAVFQGEETTAVNAMIQGFQDNDYKAVTDNLAAQEKSVADIDANLKTVNDALVTATQNAFDDSEKTNMDAWTKYIGQQNLDIAQANQVLDQSKFTEQEKVDAATLLNNSINTKIKEYEDGISIDANGNVTVQDSLGVGMSPTELPGVKELSNGTYYFDPTQFTDKTQQTTAENAARAAGITVVDPKDAPNLESATTALDNLEQAQNDFSKIATKNLSEPGAEVTPLVGLQNMVGGTMKALGMPTQYQNNITAYNNSRLTVIQVAGQLTGGNARALRAVLDQVDSILPEAPGSGALLVPTVDTTAQAQFNSARQLIYNYVKTVVPDAQLPTTGYPVYDSAQEYITDHPTVQIPSSYQFDAGKTVNSTQAFTDATNYLHTTYPQLSSDDLQQAALQLINY